MSELLKGKSILTVEDEETNWFLIRDILLAHQAQPHWAEVGQQAIDMVQAGNHYDLVLMDLNLPVMDGLEVTRRIKDLRPDLPVVIQTACAVDSEIELCYQAGCIGHVIKPFSLGELTNAIISAFLKTKTQ